MNNKGFTLVELLATLVILSIVIGITISAINLNFGSTKEKTEDVFVDTIRDAIDVYLDSDAKSLTFTQLTNNDGSECVIRKKYGNVNVEKAEVTFGNIMGSKYKPLNEDDFVNPANEDEICSKDAVVSIYRDDDYVYYYKVMKKDFNCLLKIKDESGGDTVISNLPEGYVCDK